MIKKGYIPPTVYFVETEDTCSLTGASVVQGDDDTVIDTFPVEENPKDFEWDNPDIWGGD